MKNFYQEGPRLTNTYRSDKTLQKFLSKFMTAEVRKEALPHLDHVGEKATSEMLRWAEEAGANIPQHIAFSP